MDESRPRLFSVGHSNHDLDRFLGLLRGAGIQVALGEGRYALSGPLDDALNLLPFPDPHLTLGEARQLARGRGPANRRIKDQVNRLVS